MSYLTCVLGTVERQKAVVYNCQGKERRPSQGVCIGTKICATRVEHVLENSFWRSCHNTYMLTVSTKGMDIRV